MRRVYSNELLAYALTSDEQTPGWAWLMENTMTIEFGSPEAEAVLQADREARYERRYQTTATVSCCCGKEVDLVAETEEWVKEGELWKHAGYGPGTGQCDCGRIYVEWWEGVFQIGPSPSEDTDGQPT